MFAAQSSTALLGRLRNSFADLSSVTTNGTSPSWLPPDESPDSGSNSSLEYLQLLEEAIVEAQALSQDQVPSSAQDLSQVQLPAQAPLQSQPPLELQPQPRAATPAPVQTPPLDVVAQAVPALITQPTPNLVYGQTSTPKKEVWQNGAALVAPAESQQTAQESSGVSASTEQVGQGIPEAATATMYQEVEPARLEMPVEVEGYLQEVKDNQDQLPQEIVIADNQIDLVPSTTAPLRPVVVLPITPELETAGAKKNPSWSLRWLVEWSKKLMQVFTGKIVYRQE